MAKVEHDFDAIEYYIIKCLLSSDMFCRSYIDKLTNEVFSPKSQDLLRGVRAFFKKYNRAPSPKILEDKVLPTVCKRSDKRCRQAMDVLTNAMTLDVDVATEYDWICDETKKFIKTKRIINAVVEVTDLIQEHKHDEILATMEEAFQISFDESIGIEYFSGLEDRLSRADIRDEIIPTGYKSLDERIGGGYRRKAMFVFAGASNVGKTLVLNDAASTLAFEGHNVLYLSLELSEDYIQQRTDSKFANVPIEEVNVDPAEAIRKAIARRDRLASEGKKVGKLMYKEYAPNAISANDIRVLLKNLEVHGNFKPDFIIVDYLKLVRPNGKVFSDNTYGKIVTVCEELRALAFEYNACLLSAAQTGRQSYGQTTVGMEDISDSIGIAQTVDVLVTLARNSELDADDSIIISIAKSRFSRNGGSFFARVNYKYMKIIDDASEQREDAKPNTRPNNRPTPEKNDDELEEEPKKVNGDKKVKKLTVADF